MSIDPYALVSASNLVLDVALWDGVTTWTRPASVAQTIQLNPGEDCGIGYTYVFGGTPRFVAPAATTPAEVLLNDIDYIVGTTRTNIGSGRVATSSSSIVVDKGKANEIEFQRAALTGDVTASANSNATTIANDAVTFAKMQNVATNTLLGRSTSGTGDIETITCTAAGRAILDDADASAQRTTLGAAASTSSFITISDETATYTNSRYFAASSSITLNTADAGQFKVVRAALTGDVTASSNSNTLTIANDAVTYAKMQNVSAASRLLGRGSAAGSGDVEEITLGTGLSMSGTTLSSSGGSTVTINEYTYTTSDTYTKPAGLEYIIVEGVGGGGGGGNGSTAAGGNGGCAGLYATVVIPEALITTSTLTVTIGTGGGAGVQGGDSEVTLASGGARLLYMPGGRAATNDMRNLQGGVTTNGFGAGQTAANATAGRHGGYGPGGGGPGNTTAANAAGLAGGRPSSHEFTGGNAQVGGGAAGGAAGGGAGTNASVTVRGFGEGAGGGGANTGGAGGAGGNGTRGSGGGGGGRGSTAGGAGGSGGDGFIRIIEVVVT